MEDILVEVTASERRLTDCDCAYRHFRSGMNIYELERELQLCVDRLFFLERTASPQHYGKISRELPLLLNLTNSQAGGKGHYLNYQLYPDILYAVIV